MRRFEINEEQIKKLARCGAPSLMHDWFPEAFEPEWGEVPRSECKVEGSIVGILYLTTPVGHYKIEDGKVWRRK